MWKYLKGVPPPKKRKADDEGVSDTKAKMKKYDSSAKMRTFQLSWIHGRPWLRHDKATSKMYCDVCNKPLSYLIEIIVFFFMMHHA